MMETVPVTWPFTLSSQLRNFGRHAAFSASELTINWLFLVVLGTFEMNFPW
jgi:hypothetical protein